MRCRDKECMTYNIHSNTTEKLFIENQIGFNLLHVDIIPNSIKLKITKSTSLILTYLQLNFNLSSLVFFSTPSIII